MQEIFEEDLVEFNNANNPEKYKIGLVLETSHNNSDEEEDDLVSSQIPKNKIRVVWHPSGKRQIISESKINLVDRTLVVGEIVTKKSVDNKLRGYVVNCKMISLLKCLTTSKIFYNTATSNLAPLMKFDYDNDHVYLDDWLGLVTDVNEQILIKFDDGACCQVISNEILDELRECSDLNEDKSRNSEFYGGHFYVGQLIKSKLGLFKDVNWIKSTKNFNYEAIKKNQKKIIVFVVVDVGIQSVEVSWICRGYSQVNIDKGNPPPKKITGSLLEKMVKINTFSHFNYQVGDKLYFKEDESSKIISIKSSNKKLALKKKLFRYQKFIKSNILKKKEMCLEMDPDEEIVQNQKQKSNGKKQKNYNKRIIKRKNKKNFDKLNMKRLFHNKLTDPQNGLLPVELVYTLKIVDVMWQNGVLEKDIPSFEIIPSQYLDDLEFFPGDYVVSSSDSMKDKYAVVQKVDPIGRTCLVKWNPSSLNDIPSEEMSMFDLKAHPDFRMRIGVVVVRVGGFESIIGEKMAVGGTVVDLRVDGYLDVEWADKSRSLCKPDDLFCLDSDISDMDSSSEESDYSEENYSSSTSSVTSETDNEWETEEEISCDEIRKKKKYSTKSPILKDVDKSILISSKLKFDSEISCLENLLLLEDTQKSVYPSLETIDEFLAVILDLHNNFKDIRRCLKKIDVYSKLSPFVDLVINQIKKSKYSDLCLQMTSKAQQRYENNCYKTSNAPPELLNTKDNEKDQHRKSLCLDIFGSFNKIDAFKSCQTFYDILKVFLKLLKKLYSSLDAIEVHSSAKIYSENLLKEDINLNSEDITSEIKRQINEESFKFLENVPDYQKFKTNSFSSMNKSFVNRVKKEISLLQTCLPKGIYVKGYESRMDLFSCMIQGPDHTPFEDGLFFFDIQLNSDYPLNPPKVFYWSYCSDRLNPNLYEDGKVCVSLLGTWSGKGSEVWNPQESNLLQVLISIQGLILNREPYFNEAGYEKHRLTTMGQESSRMYNEMVLIKLFQSLTNILQNPISIFETEVREHFLKKSHNLVNRVRMWLYLDQNSTLLELQNDHPKFPLLPLSKGFKIAIVKSIDKFIEKLNDQTWIVTKI